MYVSPSLSLAGWSSPTACRLVTPEAMGKHLSVSMPTAGARGNVSRFPKPVPTVSQHVPYANVYEALTPSSGGIRNPSLSGLNLMRWVCPSRCAG